MFPAATGTILGKLYITSGAEHDKVGKQAIFAELE